jgi:hypothetical protein
MLVFAQYSQTPPSIPDYIYDVTVGVKAGPNMGSGVVILREVDKKKVAFVLTCGHIFERKDKSNVKFGEVNPTNWKVKTRTQFGEVEIAQQGLKKVSYKAHVLKYSPASDYDISLLQIAEETNFKYGVGFQPSTELQPLLGPIIHCGGATDFFGCRSVFEGKVSKSPFTTPMLQREFQEVSCTILPGCSGGGIFNSKGEFAGMMLRMRSPSIGMYAPYRRIYEWSKQEGVGWALYNNSVIPALSELSKMRITEYLGEENMADIITF